MKKTIIFFLFFFSYGFTQAQDWYNMLQEADNYYEVVRRLEEYYKHRDKGQGSGYKQFKRWEYFMREKIDQHGRFINQEYYFEEVRKFKEKNAQQGNARVATHSWVELGPKTWNRTSSWNPGIGRITCIAIHPTNTNIIYIGAPLGGVWKTTNGGGTWTNNTDNLPNLGVFSLAIDPSNTNVVYMGGSAALRMYKSVDGGTTWNPSTTGLNGQVNRIIIHPTTTTIVLAATSQGIYRSTNSGGSWTQVRTGSWNDLEFKPGDPSTVYASGTGFARSSDNGVTWTAIGAANGIPNSGRSFISVTPANPNYVYMVQANGSEFGYLYRSIDSGNNFTIRVTGDAASGTNYFGYSPAGTGTGGQAGYDMAMCVSPTNADEVHIAGIICWKSTNGGTSFTATTEWSYPNARGYNHADVHALEYVGNTVYSGSDGGIFKAVGGVSPWTDLSPGLGIRQFYRIACSKTDANMVAGGAQDNGSSIKKSTGWIDWLGADGMETLIDYNNNNIIYGTSQYGSLYKSTNGGASRTDLTEPETDGAWVTPLAMDPVTSTTIYAAYNDLYRSTNGGTTWTKISNFTGTANCEALAIAPSNTSIIYVGKGGTLYKTINGGTDWTTINTPSTSTIGYITVHPTNPNVVAVTHATGSTLVYKSTNGGTTWTNYGTGLPNIGAKCAVFENNSSEGLYVGLNVGVYYRNNSLPGWVAYMNDLPNVDVRELEIFEAGSKLRAATYGRGLWETNLYNALPVEIVSLQIRPVNNSKHAAVEWTTSMESGNDYFEVQKSVNGRDFFPTGRVDSRGDGNQAGDYRWIDLAPFAGTTYYRLAQYDNDGTVHYTNMISYVHTATDIEVHVFPNPTQDAFNIIANLENAEESVMTITDMSGRVLISDTHFQLNVNYLIGENLLPGMYLMNISSGDKIKQVKLVKN
ncbi:MAG: VPS10 domain-containing protein [Cytophagaceae bacterium]